MPMTARDRNMRRILLLFGVICFALAAYLYVQAQDLDAQLRAVTAQARPVEQNPHIVRNQLRRTRILLWASLAGGVLLLVSAAAAGRRREPAPPPTDG